ncbi:MAG: GNAT family N-acetyltransferase [Minisyncoccales bacterium]
MIKKAQKNDLQILVELNNEVQDLHHKMEPGIFKPSRDARMSSLFENFLNDKNFTILIYFSKNNEPLAYLICEDKKKNETDFTYSYELLYIHQIAVLKEFQNNKIGKKLLEKVFEIAKKRNIKRIELDVWNQNEKAIKIFEKIGFSTFNRKMSLNLK